MKKKTNPKIQNKLLLKLSKGLSVLLSIIIITLVLLFSIGVTTMVTDSTRQAGNVKQGTMAYYAAEAGVEQALWVNKKLSEGATGGVGVSTSLINVPSVSGSTISFKIQGVANPAGSKVSPTVNDKYIVPFPWTGNVPWHGEGSALSLGGCIPEKPPVLRGDAANRSFVYKEEGKEPITSPAIEHPCNWGKLAVGERVSIPLYGKYGTSSLKNYPQFIVRLRAPCRDGREYCEPAERMDLNCWDKGTGEKKCQTFGSADDNNRKGEVVVAWQINAEKTTGPVTLKPFDHIDFGKYSEDDSQFYERKINGVKTGSSNSLPFVVLSSYVTPFPVSSENPLPMGRDLITNAAQTIFSFVGLAANTKPVLSLSAVSSLVGCENPIECNASVDSPVVNTYYQQHAIPYLEYQVVLLGVDPLFPPVSKDNIITAESQSGPFTQTLQVKVPTDSSSLEYVIQQ